MNQELIELYKTTQQKLKNIESRKWSRCGVEQDRVELEIKSLEKKLTERYNELLSDCRKARGLESQGWGSRYGVEADRLGSELKTLRLELADLGIEPFRTMTGLIGAGWSKSPNNTDFQKGDEWYGWGKKLPYGDRVMVDGGDIRLVRGHFEKAQTVRTFRDVQELLEYVEANGKIPVPGPNSWD